MSHAASHAALTPPHTCPHAPSSCQALPLALLLIPVVAVIRRAMCAIFGVQGYLQELILQHTFQNRYSLFVTALQCGTLAALAVVQLACVSEEKEK